MDFERTLREAPRNVKIVWKEDQKSEKSEHLYYQAAIHLTNTGDENYKRVGELK